MLLCQPTATDCFPCLKVLLQEFDFYIFRCTAVPSQTVPLMADTNPIDREALTAFEEQLADKLGPLPNEIEAIHISVPMRDGHQNEIRVLRPKAVVETAKPSKLPLLVLFHGGGYVAGSIYQVERPARELVSTFNIIVASVDYRLAPEFKFPVPVSDAWDATVWLSHHADPQLGADLEQGFLVGGFSAGGNAAAVVSYMSVDDEHKDQLKHPITGSLVSIAAFFATEQLVPSKYRSTWKSREKNCNSWPSSTADYESIERVYAPDRLSPWWNPAGNGSANTIAKLPRTHVQVAELDPVRDDGIVYKKILDGAGVQTRLDSFTNIGHMCFSVYADEDHSNFEEMKESTLSGMAWLLRRDWTKAAT